MLKTVSSITNVLGAMNYKGTWDASTNTPTLASGSGSKGDYYVVSVAGSTALDGISNWGIGDWAAFNGVAWQRLEGGTDLNGVNLTVSGTSTLSGLTASTTLALDASKNVISVINTGTGNNVLATSPILSTPILGVASATSVNKVAITAPTTGATLTIADGKTLTASNSLTFAGTDATTITFPTTSATIARTDAANSFTGNQTLATGNLVQGTASKGVNFTANTPAAGMTSQLLNAYEEGTWTPTLTSAGGNFTTIAYGDQQGTYTKVGRMVTVRGNLFTSGAITVGSASGQLYIAGLPFACGTSNLGQIWTSPDTGNYNMPLALATGVRVNASVLQMFKDGSVNNPAFAVTDLHTSGGPANNFFFQATYFV